MILDEEQLTTLLGNMRLNGIVAKDEVDDLSETIGALQERVACVAEMAHCLSEFNASLMTTILGAFAGKDLTK